MYTFFVPLRPRLMHKGPPPLYPHTEKRLDRMSTRT